MNINMVCNTGFAMPIDELNDFQGDLKTLSEEAFNSLSKEIVETGFGFAPHVWLNPADNKYYLIDGHQRIKTLKRLREDGYIVPQVPVVKVFAPTLEEAKKKVLQAISQYGKLTYDGLAKFSIDANLNFEDLSQRFDLPGIDLKKFFNDFVHEDKIVSVAAHDRVVNRVNEGDENSEWVEMPDFVPGDKEYKLILIFGSEEERKKYCDDKGIPITNKMNNQWTSRFLNQ